MIAKDLKHFSFTISSIESREKVQLEKIQRGVKKGLITSASHNVSDCQFSTINFNGYHLQLATDIVPQANSEQYFI